MRIVPLTLSQANEMVFRLHRHHKPVQGHRFSIGLKIGERLVGAAIIGRPVARMTDQYSVAEVTRLVTDGTSNACSKLYGACARICKEMGFDSIQTFILESESGRSLNASGWVFKGWTDGGSWTRISKPNRRQDQPMCKKALWIKQLC